MTDRPILVTGAPRTGTTILGRLLSVPRHVSSVYEPFNAHIGLRAIPHQFVYVTDGSAVEERVAPAVDDLVRGRGRFRPSSVPGTAARPATRLLRRIAVSRTNVDYQVAARLPWRTRWLIKDPLAAFSAAWFTRRYEASTLVTVRHPAATVASYLRLGWRFSLAELQSQPDLMRDHLDPVLGGVDAARLTPVEEGALLWRCYYTVLESSMGRDRRIGAIRQEDLSTAPTRVVRNLYDRLGLEFGPAARRRTLSLTRPGNPAAPRAGKVHTLRRDSRALVGQWRAALTPAEVATIQSLAGPVGARWYPDATDW